MVEHSLKNFLHFFKSRSCNFCRTICLQSCPTRNWWKRNETPHNILRCHKLWCLNYDCVGRKVLRTIIIIISKIYILWRNYNDVASTEKRWMSRNVCVNGTIDSRWQLVCEWEFSRSRSNRDIMRNNVTHIRTIGIHKGYVCVLFKPRIKHICVHVCINTNV